MFKEKSLARSLRIAFGTSVAGLALVSVGAHAQEVQTGEKVEVTGSSIKRIDAETSLPVQVITREDIQRLAPQSTQDLLRTISATNTVGAQQLSTGSGATTGGASSVSLRGLGSQRTLVLVNGRRIAPFGGLPGGGSVSSVDVNSIPVEAIERVEVLKDGASAIYGSDAVAGVVNFILRTDYRGALVEAQYGQTTHSGDGRSYNADALLGFGDLRTDRFNVMINASYSKEDAIYGAQRNFSKSGVNEGTGNDSTSGNTYPANIVNADAASRNFLAPRYAAQVADGTYPTFGFTNCSPSIASPLYPDNRCRYDPSPLVALVPEQIRTSVGLAGHFAINSNTEAYAEANGSRNITKYTIQASPVSDQFALNATNPYTPQLTNLLNANQAALTNAYGPDFFNTLFGKTTFILPTTSPYYPTQFASDQGLDGSPIDLRYRTIENGPRSIRDESTSGRFLAGVKGSAFNWDYDIGALYAYSKLKEFDTSGYALLSKLLPLLNSGAVNPFGPSTPAVQQQLLATNFHGMAYDTKTDFSSVNGHMSRELFQLPGGSVAIALGGDFRHEQYRFTASQEYAVGDITGYGGNGLPIAKARNVEAAFAELTIPIFKSLEADIAVRYDNYENVGNTTNPKVSLRWQPAREILFRGSLGTGFRAPALDELYGPVTQGVTANGLSDPLRCPATGSSTDCATQFTTVNGGNAALAPEKSTSATFGFILEPNADVHFGVDYFDIKLRNTIFIGGIAAESILDSVDDANKFGYLVTRAPASGGLPGPIISISQQNLNLYKQHVRGLDFDFKVRSPATTFGRLTVGLNGTYFLSNDLQNQDGSYTGVVANANAYGGSVIPRWKHVANATWDAGPWSGSVIQNFQSAYADYPSDITGDPRRVGVYETFDLQGSYLGFKGVRITAGIKNVFDKDPPYSNIGGVGYFQAGYDSSYAEVRGRFLYAKLGYEFK